MYKKQYKYGHINNERIIITGNCRLKAMIVSSIGKVLLLT